MLHRFKGFWLLYQSPLRCYSCWFRICLCCFRWFLKFFCCRSHFYFFCSVVIYDFSYVVSCIGTFSSVTRKAAPPSSVTYVHWSYGRRYYFSLLSSTRFTKNIPSNTHFLRLSHPKHLTSKIILPWTNGIAANNIVQKIKAISVDRLDPVGNSM